MFYEIKLGSKLIQRKIFKHRKPYKLTLVITRACNSRCVTCGIWKEDQNVLDKNSLNIEDYKKIAQKAGKDLLWLNLTGGEPFLRKDIHEIISYFYKYCPNLCLVNIPTNGILTSEILNVLRKILNLKKIPFHLTLSLDGLEDQQDLIRGVPGMFRKILVTYEKLIVLKSEFPWLKVSFETTLSSLNSDNIENIISYAQPLSDNYIITFTQTAEFYNNEKLRLDKMRTKLEEGMKKIQKKYKVYGIIDLIPKAFIIIANKYLKKGFSPLKKCSAGKSTVTVDWNGNMLPCLFIGKSFGNIKENKCDPLNFSESEVLLEARSCRKCWVNCEAIPTMFDNCLETLVQIIKH